jgi:2-dehydropantoate 2-reductase
VKILFFGAGVLGSLYAARLKQSGQEVTILARKTRLEDIQKHGIILEHALSGKREIVSVPVVDQLREDDAYDLIVVLVRKNQMASVLPQLASHKATPNILFMVNNPSGYEDWVSAVGAKRLVLGFAGAGGTRVGNVVRYVVVSRFLQPTTFGELDGTFTPRLEKIMRVFRDAGFPTAFTPNMDACKKHTQDGSVHSRTRFTWSTATTMPWRAVLTSYGLPYGLYEKASRCCARSEYRSHLPSCKYGNGFLKVY